MGGRKVLAEVAVDDGVLRVWARRDVSNEVRVASMRFAEELASYAIRDPGFKRARGPIPVPQDAPAIIKEMARLSALAGVGPAFTFRGALLDYIGDALAQELKEVTASLGGDHFVLARKPGRLALPGNRKLALILPADSGSKGIHTEIRPSDASVGRTDILAVVAESCILADAASAGAVALIARARSLSAGLAFLEGVPGIHGALVARGTRIGLAGNVEVAA